MLLKGNRRTLPKGHRSARRTVLIPQGKPAQTDVRPVKDDFLEARRRRMWAKAKQEELKTEQLAGTLVRKADVEKSWFKVGREIRDTLEALPSRLAGVLAAEADQARCFEILRREIRQILERIGKQV